MECTSVGHFRTQGDGMENHFSPERIVSKKLVPKDKIISLAPGPLMRHNHTMCNTYKKKEPKFVLYEPYKAAVKPIIPPTHKSNDKKQKKQVNNNLDCNVLVSHILIMSNNELNLQKGIPVTSITSHEAKVNTANIPNLDNDKQSLLSEINSLRNENSALQSQLTFQAQVNTELKSMLVAAVGEDVETRVHLLTEDKLHLAEALLKSVENLSTHQEQIEWLAGQCEVWRSKFLACSLMVEELANSKQILSQRVQDLTQSMKDLLNEIHQVGNKQSLTLQNLNRVANGTMEVSPINFIDISNKCHHLSEVLLKSKSGNIECTDIVNYEPNFTKTSVQTQAEKLLITPLSVKGSELICRAVVSSASFISK